MTKDHMLKVRISPLQLAAVKEAAKSQGMNTSEFVRDALNAALMRLASKERNADD